MFSKASPKPTLETVSNEQKFTVGHLRMLYHKLSENILVNNTNEAFVIEILRVLSEMIVFGDNKSEALFE